MYVPVEKNESQDIYCIRKDCTTLKCGLMFLYNDGVTGLITKDERETLMPN